MFNDAVLLFTQRRGDRHYPVYRSIAPHKRKREALENTGSDDRNHLGKMCGMGWVSADVREGGAIAGHMPSHAKGRQQIETSCAVALYFVLELLYEPPSRLCPIGTKLRRR